MEQSPSLEANSSSAIKWIHRILWTINFLYRGHNIQQTSHVLNQTNTEFSVLLTVHLGLIFVNNQIDTQIFIRVYLFQFSTCFEHPCAHHQENQLYLYDIWYMSLYVGDRLVCRFGWNRSSFIQTCTLDGHLHSWHRPDIALIQLILLTMSTGVFVTCRELE
jgi:hypothetical protein